LRHNLASVARQQSQTLSAIAGDACCCRYRSAPGAAPAARTRKRRRKADPEVKEALKWALKLPIQKRGPKWRALKPNLIGKEAL
jgi:hypothetical protein